MEGGFVLLCLGGKMNEVELPILPFLGQIDNERGTSEGGFPIRPTGPKMLWKESAEMLDRDRLRPNIGRVQQFDKECYQNLFYAWNQFSHHPGIRVFGSALGDPAVHQVIAMLITW